MQRLESEEIILDHREESKVLKAASDAKLHHVNGPGATDILEINDYTYLPRS